MKALSAINPERCMKCGFCMSVCPIYRHDRVETHVARGRNMLIRMVAESRYPEDEAYRKSLSYCLLCRRCESVCLAKLSPAEITIHARHTVAEKAQPPLLRRFVHRALLGHRATVARLVGMASIFPGVSVKNGKPLRHLAESAGIFSGNLSLPSGAWNSFLRPVPRHTKPAAGTAVKGRIAIFPGCVFEFFMADIARDMVTALAKAGFEVFYPDGLNCCGQAVYSGGDFTTARLMAERNIRALSGFDRVVTGCATCGSALKGYVSWFEPTDPRYRLAMDLAARSSDFSELLDASGYQPPGNGAVGESVTYHDPCHMRWHQGIAASPRRLLRSIPNISFQEMEGADACCGLGGAFGLTHRDLSVRLLDEKISSIERCGAKTVITACPGCLLQLRYGARRHRLPVEVLHISKLMVGSPSTSD